MNDDSQQTMTPPTADDSTAQAPAAPMTGADVADQAKDIAAQNLDGMMPSAPAEEVEAPAEVAPAPAPEMPADNVVTPAPADAPMPEAPAPEMPTTPEPAPAEPAPMESTDSTPPADTPVV